MTDKKDKTATKLVIAIILLVSLLLLFAIYEILNLILPASLAFLVCEIKFKLSPIQLPPNPVPHPQPRHSSISFTDSFSPSADSSHSLAPTGSGEEIWKTNFRGNLCFKSLKMNFIGLIKPK